MKEALKLLLVLFLLGAAPQASSAKKKKQDDSKEDVAFVREDVIMVGGNFSIGSETGVHLAQYTMSAHTWSNAYEPKLFVYGDSSGQGVSVYALSANRSSVFVAGQFDSISEQSQSQYCSLGKWTGMQPSAHALDKVGESGLCSRASDPASTIYAAELGEDGDLFVGGSFKSRIWDGSSFVSVENLARFDARRNLWTPLLGGSVSLPDGEGEAAVFTLAYSDRRRSLYAGGKFQVRTNHSDRSRYYGIAEWSELQGLRPFEGGSVYTNDGSTAKCVSLAIDDDRGKLYVAGLFDQVGDETNKLPCRTIGEFTLGSMSGGWPSGGVKTRTGWKCVLPSPFDLDYRYPISLLFDGALYAAGRAAPSSSWWTTANANATAAIARYSRFVETKYTPVVSHPDTDNNNNNNSSSQAKSKASGGSSRRRRLFYRASGSANNSGTQPKGGGGGGGSSDGYSDSTSGSDDSVGGSKNTTAPVQKPAFSITEVYYYAWEWLPGWRGLNGTIYALTAGIGGLEGCVLVGGEFAGEPPLVVWKRDDRLGPYTRGLAGHDPSNAVWQGKITAVTMLSAKKLVTGTGGGGPPSSSPTNAFTRSLAWHILKSLLTALLSAGIASILLILYSRRRRLSLLAAESSSGAFGSNLSSTNRVPSKRPNGISLQMLSYGFAPDLDFEFSDAYERAMRARHLVNRHSLVMIDPSEITLHDVIGEGSFGRVWSATWQTSAVAVKEFVLAQAAFAGGSMHRRDIIEEIVGEAGIMAYLRHPKILQLYGCSLTAQAIWIVSELCAYGSLRQVLDDPAIALPLPSRLRMAIDVAEGMLYLHTRDSPIVHRDLKSHNLFVVDQNGQMKVRIGDWGSARAVAMSPNFSKTMTHGVGTTCWLAPELIKDAKGSERIDVYSYGIVLWELATRQEVYASLSAAQIISKVANEGMRPPLSAGCPWNHVMEACWAEDPDDRPDFAEIFDQLSRIYEELTGEPVPSEGDGFVRVSCSKTSGVDYGGVRLRADSEKSNLEDGDVRRNEGSTRGRTRGQTARTRTSSLGSRLRSTSVGSKRSNSSGGSTRARRMAPRPPPTTPQAAQQDDDDDIPNTVGAAAPPTAAPTSEPARQQHERSRLRNNTR